MLNYYQYTQINVFKRKSIWISASLLWLFAIVVLIIVPASLKIAPDAIWNNNVSDLKVFMVLVNSIVCAIVAVVIFREGKENGTELIIAAKPISRAKIVFIKFLCLFITILIVTFISMVIGAFTFCFGTPSPTNSMGVERSHVVNIELGLLVGTIVISLFFGAIATLIAMVGGKIAIMVSTIGIAILFNLAATIIPIVATGINQYVEKQYGVNFDSLRYVGGVGDDVKLYNATCATHVKYDLDNPENSWDTLYYANEAKKAATSTAIGSYFNVSNQLSKLYNGMIPLNSSIENSTGFGEKFDSNYSLNQKNIFNNNSALSWATLPWVSYSEDATEGVSHLNWRQYGALSLEELSILSLAGELPDSIAYIRNVDTSSVLSLVNTRFIDLNSVIYSNRNKVQVENYVHSLEDEGFGVKIGSDWDETLTNLNNSVGDTPEPPPLTPEPLPKNIRDLRIKIFTDLFDEESLIYEGKPLPVNVEENNAKYNENMDIDFLAILFALYRDIQNVFWNAINYAMHISESQYSLPDITKRAKWTDKGNDSILTKLRIVENEWDPNNPYIKPIQQANVLMKRFRLYHFPAFSTNKGTSTDKHKWYSLDDKYLIVSEHSIGSSDIFSSLYNFQQNKYVSVASISTFWSLFAVSLFLLSALIYARTDFK